MFSFGDYWLQKLNNYILKYFRNLLDIKNKFLHSLFWNSLLWEGWRGLKPLQISIITACFFKHFKGLKNIFVALDTINLQNKTLTFTYKINKI